MQTKVDTADTSIREESAKLNKAVADLEAHINTSVITVILLLFLIFIGKICEESLGSIACRRNR